MVVLTKQEQIARSKLCLPLDVDSSAKALSLVRELRDYVGIYKIGFELVTNVLGEEGVNIIKLIKNEDVEIFLDMKYNDIPNTAENAAKAASKLGVYMFNVHASGLRKMLTDALKGAREGAKLYKTRLPKVLAVTMLTSIDDIIMNEQMRIPGPVSEQVVHYANMANDVGLDGVVCAAAELYLLKQQKNLKPDFMYVTPGIQAVGGVVGADQSKDRIFTPGNAIKYGSSILVAGRTITKVEDSITKKLIPATPDEMRKNAYGILQDMAKNL